MNSYCYLAPISAQAPVKVLLEVHQRFDCCIVKLQISNDSTTDERPDALYRFIHLKHNLSREDLILWQSCLDAQESSHSPGYAFGAIKVWAIREELHIYMVFIS